MIKTPEQVALDAVFEWNQSSPTISGRIVSALREAGWIRGNAIHAEWHADKQRIVTLERDLAAAQTQFSEAFRKFGVEREANCRLRASAASPEVQRVVDAAKWLREFYFGTVVDPPSRVGHLCAAVDALSASRQPKAQEPPRYYTNGSEVRERFVTGNIAQSHVSATFFGADAVARAEAECARLNGEGGGL